MAILGRRLSPSSSCGSTTSNETAHRPAIPPLRVPLEDIASVIPFATFLAFLLPYSGLDVGDLFEPFMVHLPPYWTDWLESWYQCFEATVWDLLGKDDERDLQAIRDLSAYIRMRWREGYRKDAEYEWAQEEILYISTGRLYRHAQIYSLHTVRKAYLEHRQSLKPAETEDIILSTLEDGAQHLYADELPQSVWPLYCAHPKEHFFVRACPCKIHFDRRYPYSELYGLPDVTTPSVTRLASEILGPEWRKGHFVCPVPRSDSSSPTRRGWRIRRRKSASLRIEGGLAA